ncbi:hypothetical protein MMC10_005770 [Thelotrema lepadinum]|nr:hypothetical protein [Thelotrema lepadinum]
MYFHLLFFVLTTLLVPALSSALALPKFVKPKPSGPPPDPNLSRTILKWIADDFRKTYNNNMAERIEHHAKAFEIVRNLPFFGHALTLDNLKRMKHRNEGLRAYKRGYDAAKYVTQIATVNKEIKAISRPRRNKYEDPTAGYDPAYDDIRTESSRERQPGCVFQSGKWLCGLGRRLGRVGKRGQGGKEGKGGKGGKEDGTGRESQTGKRDHEDANGQAHREA